MVLEALKGAYRRLKCALGKHNYGAKDLECVTLQPLYLNECGRRGGWNAVIHETRRCRYCGIDEAVVRKYPIVGLFEN
ncbi:MAG: hypothetical protein KKD18_00945 [Nanoarchaeota archaeon]|nr:hypothetical protein [Nanoarchaeota archaeon]